MGLVQDWNTAKDCHGSALHIYLLVAVIMFYASGGNGSKAAKAYDAGQAICTLVVSWAISVSMAIWGFIEIFDKACPELEGDLLYNMAIVTTSLHCVVIVAGIGLVVFLACRA